MTSAEEIRVELVRAFHRLLDVVEHVEPTPGAVVPEPPPALHLLRRIA